MKPIDRREALRRVAAVLGCAVSAPTVEAVLAGWTTDAGAAVPAGAGVLTTRQDELLATIAEIILPETDTPGARTAGVDAFIRVLLSDYYPPEERDEFLDGLRGFDERARRRCERPFLECGDEEQVELVASLDRVTFGEPSAETGADGRSQPPSARAARQLTDWYRRMKELTLVGYYTSEVGATVELRRTPWGEYRGDIPYSEAGQAWSY